MRKANALSRLVLGSRAAEQVENAPMILRIDPSAIVGDVKNRKAELGAAPNHDFTGNLGLEVFDRVVDQI